MFSNYQTIFSQRGSAYDRAMQRYPNARQHEFAQAIESAELVAGMVVADVPAGGGYLSRYLPSGCRWIGHEPCASFTNHGAMTGKSTSLLPLPWLDAVADVAISLAGVHHLSDKRPLFSELHRVIKPGGRLIVSDVAAGSAVAHFLDDYVGAHNSTGHDGVFLDDHTFQELRETGWTVLYSYTPYFNWEFSTRFEMASFCHELFSLSTSTIAETQTAIETMLGVSDKDDNNVGMNWSLLTVVAERS